MLTRTWLSSPACAAGAGGLRRGRPAAVVAAFHSLINAKQVPEAMRLTADDYVMNDPTGTYDRASAAQQWQGVVDAGLTFEQTNLVNADGRVTSCYLVRQNGSQVDKGCDNVTHVRKGKIIFDSLEGAEHIWVVQRYYERLSGGDAERPRSLRLCREGQGRAGRAGQRRRHLGQARQDRLRRHRRN